MKLDLSFLPEHEYWFQVVAVDEFNQISPPSNVVSVRTGEKCEGQNSSQPSPPHRNFNTNAPDKPAPPAAPKNFRFEQDGDLLTFSWDPVDAEHLAGYKVFVSDYDPTKHQGFGLKLASQEPRSDRPIQKDDLVFIDQLKTTLVEADSAPYVALPANRALKSPWAGGHSEFMLGDEGYDGSWWSDGSAGSKAKWELVEHPTPLPEEFTGHGQTCLKWQVDGNDLTGIWLNTHGPKSGTWYAILDPKEYKVEAWVRGSGKAGIAFAGPYANPGTPLPNRQIVPADNPLGIPPIEIPLTEQWTKFTGSFTVPDSIESGMGAAYFTFEGPGTLYIDNLRIYEADTPMGDLFPITAQRLRDSHIRFARNSYSTVLTKSGCTLEAMVSDAGGRNYSKGNVDHLPTFHSTLRQLKNAGVSPLLQVEMCMSEEEWLGLAEWLCAPYDPAKGDTPEKKPWAYKRWSRGQKEPWIDVFPDFAFELSNETWNQTFAPYDWDWGKAMTDGATGQQYTYGATYGLFQEYVANKLRSSPYWTPAVEDKMKFVITGWTTAPSFGFEAARHAPSTDIVLHAAYHGNYGLGDPLVMTDFKGFYTMNWSQSGILPRFTPVYDRWKEVLGEGHDFDIGIYEYGIMYSVNPGDPAERKEVDQKLARSMFNAVACLDACLFQNRFGTQDRAIFTWGHSIGAWGSHTLRQFGGHAYPFWKALTLYNQFGGGRALQVEMLKAPTWSFPEYETVDNTEKIKRPALPNTPMVSVHANAEGDRVTVFVLSRKLDNFPVAGDDGFTPGVVRLPFSKAKKITLHRMVSDPRLDDRFEEHTKVEALDLPAAAFKGSLPINEQTGADARGLPPASIFCTVFEGTDIGTINVPPKAMFAIDEPVVIGEPVAIRNSSSAANGGSLTHAWQLGSAGSYDQAQPAPIFTETGMEDLRLTVTDANGLSDWLPRRKLPVGVRFGGEVWLPWTIDAWKAGGGAKAKLDENGQLALSGGTPIIHTGRFSLLRAAPRFGKDYVFETIVDEVAGPGQDPRLLGGLLLTAAPRTGLGHGDEPWQTLVNHASLLVSPDGAVRKLKGEGDQLDELLPPGSITFPAKLRMTVKGLTATAAVETGGAWKELASFTLPDDIGLMPALAVGSPNQVPTTMTISAASVIEAKK